MKKIFFALLLLCIPIAPIGTTGMSCKPTQQRITYNTLYSVGSAVNSAYAAYNDAVVQGKAIFSPNVAKAYNDFQAAFAVAVQAAQLNPQAIAPQNIVDLSNAVFAAIKQFTH